MSQILAGRRRCVLASESTEGTDAVASILTTATADIVYQEVTEPMITPGRIIVPLNRTRGSHSGAAHASIPNVAAFSGTFPLTGRVSDSSGDEAPYYSPVLKAMNLKETIVSATTATYNPATVNQAPMSAYVWHRNASDANYRLHTARGIRGTGTFNFANNAEATVSFEGQGLYDDELTDPAAFFGSDGAIDLLKDGSTSVTARTSGTEAYANNSNRMICRNMTITVNGNSWGVTEMTLALNWSVDLIDRATGTAGVSQVLLTRGNDARISGSFNLKDGSTALTDLLTQYKAGAEIAMTVVLSAGDGSSGSANITLTASKVQLGVPAGSADGGVLVHAVPFFLNGDWSDLAGDNDFSLAYGEVA
jgi:hypothetical protein